MRVSHYRHFRPPASGGNPLEICRVECFVFVECVEAMSDHSGQAQQTTHHGHGPWTTMAHGPEEEPVLSWSRPVAAVGSRALGTVAAHQCEKKLPYYDYYDYYYHYDYYTRDTHLSSNQELGC